MRYDELLTTGWNEALAGEHSIPAISPSGKNGRHCIQGYKNDPERRIGMIGLLEPSQSMSAYSVTLSQAFDGHEEVHLRDSQDAEAHVKALACLNAFNPELIDRILEITGSLQVRSEEVLCLTGAPRELGIQAAKEAGMSVLAVGHRRCELWGLRYLERQARAAFPDLDIKVHEEEEEEPPKNTDRTRSNGNGRSRTVNARARASVPGAVASTSADS